MRIIRRTYLAALLCLGTGAAPAHASDIFASCDDRIVRAAADRLLNDPATLQEPVQLFLAAQGLRVNGEKDQAAFLYLLARLRASRQAFVVQGDYAQVVAVMSMTIGPLIMPDLAADPDFARAVIARVLRWDKGRPDPFRARALAEGGKPAASIAALEASFERLPDDLRTQLQPGTVATAQKSSETQIAAMKASRCMPGNVDAVQLETAIARVNEEALRLVGADPLVLRRAGGNVRRTSVAATERQERGLPERLTVAVDGVTGKTFYAEVNVKTSVGAKRNLTSVTASLACVTDQWIGNRTAGNDVCISDTDAIRPHAAK